MHLALGLCQIGPHHVLHELAQPEGRRPPELLPGLGAVSQQVSDLGGSDEVFTTKFAYDNVNRLVSM